jgi:hypothetical protein
MVMNAAPSHNPSAHPDISFSIAWAAALGMLLGCGEMSPASTRGGRDGGAACEPPGPDPFDRVCQAMLDLASTRCPVSWERSLAPACIHLGPSGVERSYWGPSGGYLVSARSGVYGGWMCVYEPSTRALIAEYQSSDVPEFCCASFSVWFGPKLDNVWPIPEQCNQALADGGADARD